MFTVNILSTQEGERVLREDNGQLTQHSDFIYHLEYHVPVQVYDRDTHIEIGLITRFDNQFVEIANTLFHRRRFRFISRPGY